MSDTDRKKRRIPAIVVIPVIFVLFGMLMAFTIEKAKEFGLLSVSFAGLS